MIFGIGSAGMHGGRHAFGEARFRLRQAARCERDMTMTSGAEDVRRIASLAQLDRRAGHRRRPAEDGVVGPSGMAGSQAPIPPDVARPVLDLDQSRHVCHRRRHRGRGSVAPEHPGVSAVSHQRNGRLGAGLDNHHRSLLAAGRRQRAVSQRHVRVFNSRLCAGVAKPDRLPAQSRRLRADRRSVAAGI